MTSVYLSERQRSAIKTLPKVELHLHFEGCIQPESIEALARSIDQPMIRRTQDIYSFKDLEEFYQLWIGYVTWLVQKTRSRRCSLW